MDKQEDIDLLNRFFQNDTKAVRLVYELHYGVCRGFAAKNYPSISEDQVKGLYNETLAVLYQKRLKPDFQLTSKLKTFLIGIFENKCKKLIDKNKKMTVVTDTLPESPHPNPHPCHECLMAAISIMLKDPKSKPCFEKLDKAYIKEIDRQDLASDYGVTYGTFRNQLGRCADHLRAITRQLCHECMGKEKTTIDDDK